MRSKALQRFLSGAAPRRPNPHDGGPSPLARDLAQMAAAIAAIHPGEPPEGYGWPNLYALVSARGHAPLSAPLTPEEQAAVAAAIRCSVGHARKLLPQQCYWNALQLVLADHSGALSYVEGYVGFRGFPIQHAWVEVGGKCVDPTIRLSDGSTTAGELPRGYDYWGLTIPTARVQARAIASGVAGPVLDDMVYGWPLLRRDARDAPPFPEYAPKGRARTRRRAP